MTVVIREDSTLSLDEATFDRLSASAEVSALVEEGIIALVRSKQAGYGLKAFSFVGQAVIDDDLRLVIREKSAGALEALLNWIMPEDLRDVAIISAVTNSEIPLFEAFALRFLERVAEYVRHGRLKSYRHPVVVSTSPRGRLDLRATAKIRARGRAGFVAHSTPRLTASIPPNQLLGLALATIDTYAVLSGRERELGELARVYAPLFEDVEWQGLLDRSWPQLPGIFTASIDDPRASADLRAALQYARAVVLHLGPWTQDEWDEGPPTSYFLNLASLFEDAVRQVLSDTVGAAAVVQKGAELDRFLFKDVADIYRADPDVVISVDSHPVLVGDVKYKTLENNPSHDDLYQLTSHCMTLGVKNGTLFYPGDEFRVVGAGTTSAGLRVRWVTLRPANLQADLREFLSTVGVTTESQASRAGVSAA